MLAESVKRIHVNIRRICIVMFAGASGQISDYQVCHVYCFFTADVYRLEQGLEPQHYDAFLLFAEEDQDFAIQIVDRMETEYGLKVLKQCNHSVIELFVLLDIYC
jgi:hypothetical protein